MFSEIDFSQIDLVDSGSNCPSDSVLDRAEIDVEEVVRELHRDQSEQSPACDKAGFDLAVKAIDDTESPEIQTDPCLICGSVIAKPKFEIEGMEYRLVECASCGIGRLNPAPTVSEVAQFYPPAYYGSTGAKFEPIIEAIVKWVGKRRVTALTRGLPKGARVLDVGCGRGVLLEGMAEGGFEAHGFEISETASEGADPRAQIRHASDLREANYPENFFDQVILWHVLEHLPHPNETLREIRRILRPGGRLAVAVPNYGSLQSRWTGASWFHLDLPRHLFHFTLPTLRRLLVDCGFDCRQEHHFSLRQNPFGWVQSLLNCDESLPRNGLYSMLKRQCGSSEPLFDRSTSFLLRAVYFLGMPLGLIASVLTAGLRSGASVWILAEAC